VKIQFNENPVQRPHIPIAPLAKGAINSQPRDARFSDKVEAEENNFTPSLSERWPIQ
jgi:hypothetical protein